MIPCSAVLMAGGKSTRMGCDKAWLDVDGVPLWQVQIGKLRDVASEVLISARPGQFPEGTADVPVVLDETPGLGPLGGLVSVLPAAKRECLLLLAVDMPEMTVAFLAKLAARATPECGVVPVAQGFYQGLAAIYPQRILPLVKEILAGTDHSFQHLHRTAVEQGLMRPHLVNTDEEPLFRNWNRPTD